MEVDADAAAVCGEDQCGEVGDGAGGGEGREGFACEVKAMYEYDGESPKGRARPGRQALLRDRVPGRGVRATGSSITRGDR